MTWSILNNHAVSSGFSLVLLQSWALKWEEGGETADGALIR